MERLTREDRRTKLGVHTPTYSTNLEKRIYLKLFQLENLEEELDIDLITLFMVLKQDYIYFKTYYGWNNKFKIEKERITGLKYIDDNTLALFTDDYYGKEHIIYLKDYGTKWSLRKEDLEDED